MSSQHTPRQPAEPPPPALPVSYPGAALQEAHLLDRLGILYKHRRVAITVFLLTVVGMALRTYTTVPVYRAQARVLIELERPALEGLRENVPVYSDEFGYFETQLQVLNSRGLARRVVTALGLKGSAEVNSQRRPPSGIAAVIARAREAVRAPLDWVFGKPAALRAPEPPSEDARQAAVVDAFLGGVEIRPVRDTQLAEILYDSTDPEFAARAASTIAEEYVRQNLELKLQSTQRTLDWVNSELTRQQEKVETSERAMADYRETQNAMALGDRQNIVVASLNQLNDQLNRAKTTRIQKESLYTQVKSLDPSDVDSVPGILQNQYIQTLKSRLAELQREKARLSERYLERHPEMLKLDGNIQDVSRQLGDQLLKAVAAVESEYRSALDEEQRLGAELERAKVAAQELNRKEVNYVVLQRQAETDREVYQMLLQRQKELTVASNSKSNNVRVMDLAETPKAPFSPDPWRNMFIANVLGLVLAIGLVFGIEYLDDTIKTPEEITQKLRLPFLGLVPAVRGDTLPVLLGAAPHDFAESFRALRTSLVFSSGSESRRVIAVTSAQPLEGKTTTSCNLAAVLAFGGARVLLIDADMRRPGIHRTLGLENTLGLSHLLVGQARVRDVVQRTPEPNLYVMTAGRTPPNPSELLGSERMKHLLSSLSAGPFDWVIIDTPPVLAVTDAVILAPLVSGITLVLGAQMTRQRLAERAIEMLMASKPHMLGAILNRVDFDRNKYYYSRYYGYQYKSYYGHSTAASA